MVSALPGSVYTIDEGEAALVAHVVARFEPLALALAAGVGLGVAATALVVEVGVGDGVAAGALAEAAAVGVAVGVAPAAVGLAVATTPLGAVVGLREFGEVTFPPPEEHAVATERVVNSASITRLVIQGLREKAVEREP